MRDISKFEGTENLFGDFGRDEITHLHINPAQTTTHKTRTTILSSSSPTSLHVQITPAIGVTETTAT
jgi:hypothetical protein